MNDKTKQALELALVALTKHSDRVTEIRTKDDAITAIREALAEHPAQQEPYAWMAVGGTIWRHKTTQDDVPLYKSPPPSKPLTDEELSHIHGKYHDRYGQPIDSAENGWAYERAIIRAANGIKEKKA